MKKMMKDWHKIRIKKIKKLSQSEDIQHESLNNEDVSLTSNKTDDSEHLEKIV